MTQLPIKGRTLAVAAVLVSFLALFAYVAVRAGPLAAVAVTVDSVESRAMTPELFGIGTVESRFNCRIGPTTAGRVKRVLVDVGDRVTAGQVLGEMDPVDFDARIRSQDATLSRSTAVLRDADARQRYAQAEATRYEQLLAARSTSEEVHAAQQQSRQMADAALAVARDEVARANAERDVLLAQRKNLVFVSPVDGLVSARDVDPGTTVVAGQAVVTIIDPGSLWVHVRFDQSRAGNLKSGLAAHITLRSRAKEIIEGNVLRVEPRADAVTEEMLAKVVFASTLDPLPSIGELTEVTVSLASLPASPVVRNAAIQHVNGATGVWQLVDGSLHFTPVTLGATDLDGSVQITSGLRVGDRIVVHSAKALKASSRITVVDQIPGVAR